MTDTKPPALPEPVAWRYDIQYGPEGEANYAWVYRGTEMIATMKTHNAAEIVALATQLSEVLGRADRAEKLAEENFTLAVRNGKDAREWRSRATTAEAALEGARKVIEPFGRLAKNYSGAGPSDAVFAKGCVYVHDLRKADQWLSANPEVKG